MSAPTADAAPAAKETPKQPTLRIGNKGEGKNVRIPFENPDTITDFYSRYGENEDFLLDCAARGLRIKIQDATRDMVAEELKNGAAPEAVVAKVLQFLDTTDISAKKERKSPGPRKPPTVTLDPTKGTYSAADLQALLAAQGIVVQTGGQA